MYERRTTPRFEWVIPGFVVLSVVLLFVLPIWRANRNEELRARMDTVLDPVREQVTEVQYNLARDMAALRGFLLTGDPIFMDRHVEVVGRTAAAIEELADLVPALGEPALESFIELRVRVDRWHQLIAATEGAGPESVRTAAIEQRQYQAALEAAARLDAAVAEAARSLREDLRAQEQKAIRYTALLAILALIATMALLWLGRRLRRLAEEAERQRREAQDALAETRRSVESRHRLIRGVTHDVKNPLGAADGYAELLELGLRGPMGPLQEETIRSIRRSITSAVETINDLLALSEAEGGRLGLRPEDVRLAALVDEVVEAHRGVAEAAGRSLHVDDLGPDPVVRTDPRRVEQVLSNLLSNALKHSAPGGAVRVSIVPAPDGAVDRVGIRVADSGPGIPEEDLERIFEEFHRLDPGRPGHGLGLTISRMIARRLGGELVAWSRPGEGAAFTLVLPAGDRDGGEREGREPRGAAATG